MPLKLSDDELAAVFDAARPLPVDLREPFLLAVAHALGNGGEIGPGLVHRTVRELQRQFFDPPDLARTAGTSKWR